MRLPAAARSVGVFELADDSRSSGTPAGLEADRPRDRRVGSTRAASPASGRLDLELDLAHVHGGARFRRLGRVHRAERLGASVHVLRGREVLEHHGRSLFSVVQHLQARVGTRRRPSDSSMWGRSPSIRSVSHRWPDDMYSTGIEYAIAIGVRTGRGEAVCRRARTRRALSSQARPGRARHRLCAGSRRAASDAGPRTPGSCARRRSAAGQCRSGRQRYGEIEPRASWASVCSPSISASRRTPGCTCPDPSPSGWRCRRARRLSAIATAGASPSVCSRAIRTRWLAPGSQHCSPFSIGRRNTKCAVNARSPFASARTARPRCRRGRRVAPSRPRSAPRRWRSGR